MAIDDSQLETAIEDSIQQQMAAGGVVEWQDGSKRVRMADPTQQVESLMRLRRARQSKMRLIKPLGD